MKLNNIESILWYKIPLILLLLFMLCTYVQIFKYTGDVLIGFSREETVPYVLQSNDIDLGCAMSKSFAPFILSFSRVTTEPNELAIMLYLLAGNCSEIKAWEEELRYLRAVHSRNVLESQDAKVAYKRFLNEAARRQLAGYSSLVHAIAEPGDECPVLDSDEAEFYWLIGLLNGLQAMLNDLASGSNANVPLDIASKIGRGATCLNNEKWWGLPKAIQVAIWVTIPGKKPADVDPLKVLDQSIQIGLQQGVIITQVLATRIYMGLGQTDQVKAIIRQHKATNTKIPTEPRFRLLNELTTLQLQAISDRLWTEATGKRTPFDGLGSFWDDPEKDVDTIDIDDLL